MAAATRAGAAETAAETAAEAGAVPQPSSQSRRRPADLKSALLGSGASADETPAAIHDTVDAIAELFPGSLLAASRRQDDATGGPTDDTADGAGDSAGDSAPDGAAADGSWEDSPDASADAPADATPEPEGPGLFDDA